MPKVGKKSFAYTQAGRMKARIEAAKQAAKKDREAAKQATKKAREEAEYKELREEIDRYEAYKAGFEPDFSKRKADGSFYTSADHAKKFAKIKGAKTHKGVKMVPARDEMALRATEPTKPEIRTMSAKKRALAELKALRKRAKNK